jgi:hypothetical protein
VSESIPLSSDLPVEHFHELKNLLIDVDTDGDPMTPSFSVNFLVTGAGACSCRGAWTRVTLDRF